MTLPAWPPELYRPLVDGFQRGTGDNRRFGQFDNAPPTVRRGTSKATESVSVSFVCSYDQKARFERFYDDECKEGAAVFTMPAWDSDGVYVLTADGIHLLDHEDDPLLVTSTWACLFGQGGATVTPFGLDWKVAFELVILP
ncbi:hypothetical protein NO932_11540 [Pelagibacterium sp. 26DY04]|uniref:hypothetical protein n=1 Tax=Pelagibacterium sp. 26DY04 TaxID=2967130 RepID=UPI002815DB8F|nr:hypothetical protein [Pelagibacterium sp. 26DY04]WMT85560.1 hypothetical protein NO932_11540 [Pelagibacterium sp. 26DY04]